MISMTLTVVWQGNGKHKSKEPFLESEKNVFVSATGISGGGKAIAPLSILVAEDDGMNRKLITHALARLGYQCDSVLNGKEVMDAVAVKKYHLILMDIMMPVMDGYETSKQLSQIYRDSRPIIFAITAHSLEGKEAELQEKGMDDYITKPFNIEDIKEKIAKWNSALFQKKMGNFNGYKFINLNILYDLADGDEAFLHEILKGYLEIVPGSIRKLQNIFEQNNLKELAFSAHRLKSSFRFLGAKEVGELLEKIEDECYENRRATQIEPSVKRAVYLAENITEELKEIMKNLQGE